MLNQIKQKKTNKFINKNNIKKSIFLIRHGECVSNVKWPIKNYQDSMDLLTPVGIKQINNCTKYFKKNFKNIKFKIITSTLTRAIQSGNIIKTKIKAQLLKSDLRIVEKNHEEKFSTFKKRIKSFFKSRIKKNSGPYIIVTHGHLIETLLILSINAKYQIKRRIDGTMGIAGIWGVHNGSISAIIDGNFVFFNKYYNI